jgi:CheY-like chemotaxis protein
MEEDLMRSQRIESLGVLAGGIAHDFNNMLVGITANLSLLAAKNPAGADILQDALAAAKSAQALTAQLLSFSKGGQPVKIELCLRAALKEVFSMAASGSSAARELEVPEELWSVEGDVNQLKQAVNNLLLNAVQAMPSGGTLRLKAENIGESSPLPASLKPGQYVKIAVSDSGIGIQAQHLAHIFEPYFTTKTKGHGLGLAMVWRVIRDHGGCIEAASEPGRGTEFRLFLPSTGRPMKDGKTGEKQIIKGSGRILLLEDEEIVSRAVVRMLTELGYTCEVTADGRETLKRYAEEKAAGRPFAAVISDLTIPGGMGGNETGKELRRLYPEALLIVSSGYSDEAVMAQYKTYGFDAVLPKPYRYEDISETLSRLLKKE